MMNKNHMINSGDSQRAFDKVQQLLMIKTLDSLHIEGIYLNITNNPTTNTMWSGQKLKFLSLNCGKTQKCQVSPFLLNIVL
jgi:hypothetical protein